VNTATQSPTHTYFVSVLPTANTIDIRAMENSSLETVWDSLYLPPNLHWIEIISFIVDPGAVTDKLYLMGSAFNADINKDVVVVKRIDFNRTTGSYAEYEEIAFTFMSKNTYPTDMKISAGHNLYIWGHYDKNIAGTTHDLFLTKVAPTGDIVFSKTYASYNGQDDIATELVFDSAGNLFGLSQSTDNVAPFSQHIAAFRINPNNGKRLWIKRIGTGSDGSELAYCAAGSSLGNGLAFGGNVPDGTGGRNAKIWRLDAGGNTIWNKTVSFGPLGTLEACRGIGFSPFNGDVYFTGVTGPHYFIARMSADVNVYNWSPQTVDITGDANNGPMQVSFNFENIFVIGGTADQGGISDGVIVHFSEIEARTTPALSEELHIYPNPTQQMIHVPTDGTEGQIFVYDATGRCVRTVSIVSVNTQIDLQDLLPGTYFISIYQNGNMQHSSCVKM
ncbi:MAG: T9SS type A sorting domain-containing protein, partial [Chitinophagales bacterium]